MRICQIMLGRGFGGAERYFVDLSNALAARGHDVLAICDSRGMARELLGARAGLHVQCIHAFGYWDPIAALRVRRLIAAYHPDVVEAHLARAAHIAGRALCGSRAPLVAKTHNYVQLKHYGRVDLFVPTTIDQHRHLLAAGIAPEHCALIPNFSSIPPVPEVPEPDPGIRLVAFGRFVHKKGFHVLLDAVARLRREGLAPALALGGDGPLRAGLERQARQLGLGGSVRFCGWQSDVSRFLQGASLFVMPSLDEPFGITVLEAMASGVPIVATSTQGPREVLTGDCAYLVPAGDDAALAAAIAGALRDPQERRRKAEAALCRFRDAYCEEVVVTRLLDVFRRLAAGSVQQAVGP